MVVVWGLSLACWSNVMCFSLGRGCVTRRKLVNPNHALQHVHCNSWREICKNKPIWLSTKSLWLWIWENQQPKSLVGNNFFSLMQSMTSFLQVCDMLEDLHLSFKDQKWALCSLVYFILDVQCQKTIYQNKWIATKKWHSTWVGGIKSLLQNVVLGHTSQMIRGIIRTWPHLHVTSLVYNRHRLDSTIMNGVMS